MPSLLMFAHTRFVEISQYSLCDLLISIIFIKNPVVHAGGSIMVVDRDVNGARGIFLQRSSGFA